MMANLVGFLIDTLIWSGALIALPLLRLAMPPLVLPAWLAPAVAPRASRPLATGGGGCARAATDRDRGLCRAGRAGSAGRTDCASRPNRAASARSADPPVAPEAPVPPRTVKKVIVIHDEQHDGEHGETQDGDARFERRIERDGKTIVLRSQRELDETIAEMEQDAQ